MSLPTRHIFALLLAVFTAQSFGCSSNRGGASSSAGGSQNQPTVDQTPRQTNHLDIDDYAFRPAVIQIAPGTEVTWVNHDGIQHTVTSKDNQFGSDSLSQNQQFTHTFPDAGTYEYYCKVHPAMKGKVIVK